MPVSEGKNKAARWREFKCIGQIWGRDVCIRNLTMKWWGFIGINQFVETEAFLGKEQVRLIMLFKKSFGKTCFDISNMFQWTFEKEMIQFSGSEQCCISKLKLIIIQDVSKIQKTSFHMIKPTCFRSPQAGQFLAFLVPPHFQEFNFSFWFKTGHCFNS